MDRWLRTKIARLERLIETQMCPLSKDERHVMAALIVANPETYVHDGAFDLNQAFYNSQHIERDVDSYWVKGSADPTMRGNSSSSRKSETVRDAILAAFDQQRRAGRGY